MLKPSYPYYLANRPELPNLDLEVTDKYTGEVATRVAMADAKAIEAQQKQIEQASHESGAAATGDAAAAGTPAASVAGETPAENASAIGEASPVSGPETAPAVKQVSDTKSVDLPPAVLFDGENLPPVPPAE